MANVQLQPEQPPVRVNPDEPANRRYAYFVSFVAAVGGFLFGYDLLIISGAAPIIKNYFSLSEGTFWGLNSFGLATSSGLIGCILGPSLGAYLCDRLGRKSTLIIAALLFAVGAIGTTFPPSINVFNLFRILGGVGVGLASLASPMYINEIAPARKRGSLGLMYQFAVTIGATSAVAVAWLLAKNLPDTTNWRWMFASILIPIAGFVVLLVRVPQSPRWLAEKNRDEEALAILIKIDGPENARREMEEIKNSLTHETGSWSELFRPGIRLALFIGIMLGLFAQWTGWSGVAFYIPYLLQRGGYPVVSDAIGLTIYPMLVHVSLTIVAIWLVDRLGRRPLWMGTSVAMIVALLLTALVFHLGLKGPIVILMILLIAAPHAIGFGPLPWLMMSEIFPTRIRARGVCISTTFLWIAGFSGPFAFPKLLNLSEDHIGSPAGIFLIYAVVSFLALLFGWFLLPETKGRSLEEIGGSWGKSQAPSPGK